MNPIEPIKFLGVLSIVITWVGLVFLIRKWPGNKSMSFSSHAASARAGSTFYGLLFSISLPPFYLFVWKWLVPTLSLPESFVVITAIGCIGQLIAVWVPGTNRRRQLIHNISAYTMHTLLLILVFIILVNGHISELARNVAILAEIYMLSVWFMFVFSKAAKNHTLRLQASYVAAFHVTVLTATYLR